MSGSRSLVIGASGFLGSHTTRLLAHRGDRVRVLLRETSSTRAIDDLDVERHYGDVFDDDALRSAMTGVTDVYYCAVDTRAWLRDPAPLFRTNVDGLRHALDAAVAAHLRRFVFTSSIATIGIPAEKRPATEEDAFNWGDRSGAYIRSRVQAEELVVRYARERRLPAVAMCVSNTYGPGDWQPTPHGRQVALAAAGRLPFSISGWRGEVVGVEDAAAALLLAADKGRDGERYIVSERMMGARELYGIAAEAAGVAPPRIDLPVSVMYAAGTVGDLVMTVLRRDSQLSRTSVRLMHIMPPLDHGKAERELGWRPAPVEQSIRRAVEFYATRRRERSFESR